MKLATVIQTIQDKYMANITVGKAYWATRKAREEVHGRTIQQYAKLRDYCAGILRANPGSSVSILVNRPSLTHQLRFMRMSMCIDAVKKGFLAGYRPIIGVDGCHLKGDHGQQLVVAVGRDPNDNYFPIAVAVVKAETKDNCGWFLEMLLNDIGESKNWVFMSNQQKTKSHFTFLAKSDMLINNISEVFNGRILEARDKPILTMFEWSRCYLMTSFAEKKKKEERYEGSVLPKPKKQLNVIVVRVIEWQAKWAGDLKFEVHHKNRMIMERFVVDLMAEKCSCRFWGLCGMPCPHAYCAIFEKGDNPKDYCSNYYIKVAYLATYGQSISPINGENMWSNIKCDTIVPLIFRVKPRRPRMVRIREPDENKTQTKYRKTGTSITYNNCGQYGHNKRHYPNPIVTAFEGTQGSDATIGTGGGDAAANEPGVAVEANGSETATTARSRVIRGRGRGRVAVEMGRGRGRGKAAPMTAPLSQPPNTPAPPS
ncbi:uncharacterized protein [Arachis hypogaea]|uniref:uncharacterized protein n=1 Tax=Arachis hypogaea TaxID=3818 RepID=UPI003B0E7D4F